VTVREDLGRGAIANLADREGHLRLCGIDSEDGRTGLGVSGERASAKRGGRTEESARAGRATGLGAVAVLMRWAGGSERAVGAVSSNGLFAGTAGVGAGVGAGVAMSGVRSAAPGVCENGQKSESVQLRGHADDWNRPCVENMSKKHAKARARRILCDAPAGPLTFHVQRHRHCRSGSA
jgi:hypothetical protein